MKEIGQAPIIEVPVTSFGFLQIPEKANQIFQEAFKKEFKQYSSDSLTKMINGHCKFNEDGLLQGSNPFVLGLLRQKNLLPEREYLFSPQDFAKAFNQNSKAFRNTYQDLGFAITINPDQIKEKNKFIKKLAKDIRDFGYKASLENPIFVPHTSFNPEANKNSPYGFTLKLKDEESITDAPAYEINNTIKKFTKYDQNAIPIPTKDGTHTIYTVPSSAGVFQVYSGDGQSAVASCDVLSVSGSGGRVVVGNAVPQNYTKALNRIK